MTITINNPLVLVNLTVLGFGVEIYMDQTEEGWKICLKAEAFIWSGCWSW